MGPKRDPCYGENSVAEAPHMAPELNKQNTAYVDPSLVWKGWRKEQYWSNKTNETITKPSFLGFFCFVFKRMEPLGSLGKLVIKLLDNKILVYPMWWWLLSRVSTHVHTYVPVCVVYACVCIPVCTPLHKVHRQTEVRDQHGFSSTIDLHITLRIWEGLSHWAWILKLPGSPRDPLALTVSAFRSQGLSTAWLLHEWLGSKLRSSCVYSKHLTYWAIRVPSP